MKKIPVVSLIVIALAALAALVLIGRKVSGSLHPHDGLVFDTTQVSQVVWLRVIYQTDTAELERRSGVWVTVRDGAPAVPERVERSLHGLLGIRDREQVSMADDDARLEDFGIDAADAKQVEWRYASGKTDKVLLGKTSDADFNSLYWKWPDRPGVYRTPGDFTYDLASQVEEWKTDGPPPAFQEQ